MYMYLGVLHHFSCKAKRVNKMNSTIEPRVHVDQKGRLSDGHRGELYHGIVWVRYEEDARYW